MLSWPSFESLANGWSVPFSSSWLIHTPTTLLTGLLHLGSLSTCPNHPMARYPTTSNSSYALKPPRFFKLANPQRPRGNLANPTLCVIVPYSSSLLFPCPQVQSLCDPAWQPSLLQSYKQLSPAIHHSIPASRPPSQNNSYRTSIRIQATLPLTCKSASASWLLFLFPPRPRPLPTQKPE